MEWESNDMTGRRASVTWKLEESPTVEGDGAFEYLAPSLDFTYTSNNNIKYSYTLGSKFYDLATVGRFSGSWSVNLTLDYNHFKWLLLAFEGYEYSLPADMPNGLHRFYKSNTDKLRTATFCVKKLNRIVGGTYDQTIYLKGCVVNNVKFSYETSSTSTVRCTMSGVYMTEEMSLNPLTDTDFDDAPTPSIVPVEWGCLRIVEDNTETPIANNERTSMSISQQVSTLPTCGSRFDSDFYEGQVSKISTEMSVYSRDPQLAYLRVYTGGEKTDLSDITSTTKFSPRMKGIKPLPQMKIASTYENNDYICNVVMSSVIFESMNMSLNAGSQIIDRPSLACRDAEIQISSKDINSRLQF